MRIFERLQYLASLSYLSIACLNQGSNTLTGALYLASICLTVASIMIEGVRMAQYPSLISLFILSPISFAFTGICCSMTSIQIALTLLSSSLLYIYGESDYSQYKFCGTYKVGYKTIRTDKYDNEIGVYYPIDTQKTVQKLTENQKAYLVDPKNVNHFVNGMNRAMTLGHPPKDGQKNGWFFKHLMSIVLDAVKGAQISKDFHDGAKPIVPIVLSHGLSGNYQFYHLMCADYASNGFIVFAINHRDDTCTYTFSSDGKPQYFDSTIKLYDLEKRLAQLNIRAQEAIALIDEICDSKKILNKLDFVNEKIKIDTNRIGIMGHSFGGATAIKASQLDSRIKATIAYDPWMYLLDKEVQAKQIKLNSNLISITAEGFHHFSKINIDQWKDTQLLHEQATQKENNENLFLKSCHHNDYCDLSVIWPFEIQLLVDKVYPPRRYAHKVYQMNIQLGMSFLGKIGFGDNYSHKEIVKENQGLIKRFVTYDNVDQTKQ
eukprot:403331108